MTTSNAAPAVLGKTTPPQRQRGATVLAIGSLAGPILIAVGTALDWTGDGSDPLGYLGRLADARAAYFWAGVLLVVGMALLPVTAVGVFRAASGRGRSATLRVGGVLLGAWGVFGVAGVAGGHTAGLVAADLVGIVPDATAAHVFVAISDGPFTTITAIAGAAGFFLGTVVTGIGILLANGLPTWSGIVTLAAIPASLVQGTGIHWLGAGGFLLLAVGIAGLVPAMVHYRSATVL